MSEAFDKFKTYNVFVKKTGGGGTVVLLVEKERAGYADEIYGYTSDGTARQILSYEISSKGVMIQNWINRALLARYGYVGTISGYGANAYLDEGGGNIRKFVKDYGKLAKRKNILLRILRFIFR